jgi:hypothetical protein
MAARQGQEYDSIRTGIGRTCSAARLSNRNSTMMHSVQFLDRTGHVLSRTNVQAPSEIDAFRIVARHWPPGAYSVRILPTFDVDEPRSQVAPAASACASDGLEAGPA